ncbi:non-ribosomal peptide synthetase [Pectobacterium odoriferum]|uniref:non-ribosomal peptide synthetase n=1 Tax=Pectobacterium odoriferum TaxID=78398 RepID=UPI00068C6248|nr:non-ribosomal peptide synthetase [Pectobacterium odoriferum]MBA0187146.1 non-ribosomal peptide synthetase [Pectobacterium odoriferum]MCA6962981.1 non-ribosomal peptide synthetase [Pectobacterium odoriferum]MCH5011069.1 non-ribosomal peptide synthetase [Pectobacterium odoriferum]POD91479.1 hypothetical protein BV925_12845 [Pectobacterium odoriferum]POD98021.1 hypothetical protein BVY05_20620 [Pectobacterium odoriferum]
MSDNYIAVNEAVAVNWNEIISAYSGLVPDVSYYSERSISTQRFSLSDESSSALISIANGSDKRLSMLLATLAACAQAAISYNRSAALLTGNYVEDEDVEKTVCLPVQCSPECTFKETIIATSNSMQKQLPYGVTALQSLFENPAIFALAVVLKGCQHIPDDLYQHSLTHVIFNCDEGRISCEVGSRLGADYSAALMRLVHDWAGQMRSPLPISQLEISEPFLFSAGEAPTNTAEDASILDHFQQQVERYPNKTAVSCDVAQLSYAELDALSTNGAAQLHAAGINKGDSIGIHMPRTCAAIVAIFAVLKAGGRYCPFDIHWPDSRKQHVLITADIRLTVVTADTPLALSDRQQITYDELQSVSEDRDAYTLPDLNGQDSAYIIFTSGSTGNPKGVEVPHGAVINLVQGLEYKVYRHYPSELNVSVISALSFDASVQQMYPALLLGHTLHIVPDNIRKDGAGIVRFWQEREIHIADCTPTHLRMIRLQMKGLRKPCPVMHLMIGGEKLERKNWQTFAECWDSAPNASNAYGPTECCVQSLSFEFNVDHPITTPAVPIGTPMLGEEIALIDASLRILPRGAVGEIAIAGKGVAKGYINAVELTKKSFVQIGDKRYYRTGDLAKYIGDDGLLFIGRIDSQVKISGYRIELGEIEAAIQDILLGYRQHGSASEVVDVYVMINTRDADNPILIAYICSDIAFNTHELRQETAARLPDYMVPAYFIAVAEFSQNSSGKIDNSRLPDPCDVIVQDRVVSCGSDTERKIRDLWSELLATRKENIHPNASFFDLGGTSFKLAQLSIRLSDTFSRDVEVVDLFKYTTVALQADYIDNGAVKNIASPDIHDSVEQFDSVLKMFGH